MSLGSAVWLNDVSESLRSAGERALRAFASAHGIAPAHCHLLAGPPAQALPALVERLDGDVLVVGTIQRRGLEQLIIGSTAERILQHAGCDILAIKPEGFTERLAALRAQRLPPVRPIAALAARTALRYASQ
jgi:universal stress protein E